ncbi:MAG: acyltransferase [Flavobacteriaceae bacterium]|nr:acyltransferase [Flavobacteriaceae bacterium]
MLKLFSLNIVKEYRPELNGLRALAVILVLLFHLDFPWMKGGFLGVDVFLVISGYFISKNILYGLHNGSFSFTGFYTKRLRRLFPALIFTLIVVIVAGYFLLTPSNYERLGRSTIFSSFSLSNFFFWSESGYFNTDASTKPLLHMWSLSLEEQFYLFWPLLLVTLHKFLKRFLFVFIVILVLGSLLLCELHFTTNPNATFFLIPFRMFEFLLGACCIWLERFFIKKPNYLLEIIFGLGLALIVYSAVEFDNLTRMPGLVSLIPCFGAMLIVMGGKAPMLSWVLKNRTVELIGKASYSIYLIHWPLIVYYKYWTLLELTLVHQISLGLISFVLGLFMWYFIENSFRYRRMKKIKVDPIWYVIPTLILVVSIISGVVWKSEGIPSRYTDELYMPKAEILANRKMYFAEYKEKGALLDGKPNKGHVMVMGNSHSIDLIFALRQNGFEAKITALKTQGKCYNFGESFVENAEQLCTDLKEQNLRDMNWKKVDAIYLHDNWRRWDLLGFRRIVKRIRATSNAPIFVFGPKLTYKTDIPEIVRLAKSMVPETINCKAIEFASTEYKGKINDYLKEEFNVGFYNKIGVYFINIFEIQGGANYDSFEIISKKNLKFLYFDKSHFTQQGSKEFGVKLKKRHPYLFDIDMLKESEMFSF